MDGAQRMTHEQRIAFAFILIAWSGILAVTCSGCGVVLDPPYCEEPVVGLTTEKIVGGESSAERRSLAYIQGNGYHCSATVVGPHTVLTAGHCEDMTDVLVEGEAWYDVTASLTHPDYLFPTADLQLLYVAEVLPEPYAELATTDIECVSLLAQGYGIGSEGLYGSEREVFQSGRIGDQLFNSTAIAPGDSGGPLYAFRADGSYVLIGVASWGWGGADVEYEGGTGHISVPEHHTWITENIK